METILGLFPMGLNDALAIPMADVFDSQARTGPSRAKVGDPSATGLPLPPAVTGERGCVPLQADPAPIGRRRWPGSGLQREDHLDTAAFNLALWRA